MAPSRGVILLGDVASRTESLAIVCRLCLRRGLLRTDRLLAEHGQNMPMPDLLRLLAAGCPKLDSHSITDRSMSIVPIWSDCSWPLWRLARPAPRSRRSQSASARPEPVKRDFDLGVAPNPRAVAR
jgi:hypothetical protein